MKLKLKIQLNKGHKKLIELTRVNPPDSWPESWDEDSLVESKSKQIMKYNS
jgi:hypothetical protein